METLQPSPKTIHELLGKHGAVPIARNLSQRSQWRLLILSLVICDWMAISLAFRVAHFIRFDLPLGIFKADAKPLFDFYQNSSLVLAFVWIFIFALIGLYNRQKILVGTKEYSLIFNATTVGMFMIIAVGFLETEIVFARGWLLMAWGFIFLFASMGRFAFRRMINYFRQYGWFTQNAIIVGANREGSSLAEQFLAKKSSGLNIIGFVDQKHPAGTTVLPGLNVLGSVDNLAELVSHYNVEELILASSALSSREKMVEIFQKFGVSGAVNVRMSSGLYEIFTTGLTIKDFAYVPLVSLNKVRLHGIDHLLKWALDYSLTIPALVILAPVLLLIALLVKIDSPGPVIFRRCVLGMNGRRFNAYKFRTMKINGEEILAEYPDLQKELAQNYKLKEDPRVTRLGSLLRKTSLDELPQFINVLKREMSLVGPRIITPDEVEKYSKWDLNLQTVRPGITGLWQVSGRSDVSYAERVRLDMYYIRNWSIWLDFHILIQTIPAVIKGRGAY